MLTPKRSSNKAVAPERDKSASRVAVVTNGATGVGLAVVQRLAKAGHPVAMFDVEDELLEEALRGLQADDYPVSVHKVDITDRSQVDAAIAAVRARFGPIAIAVTFSGIDASGISDAVDLTINLTGTVHCLQAAIPDMLTAGWGRIVAISCGAPFKAPSCAHDMAWQGGTALTKALSVEFSPFGITANSIPSALIDAPGMCSRDEVAATCAFLCSDRASSITGRVIGVSGGCSL